MIKRKKELRYKRLVDTVNRKKERDSLRDNLITSFATLTLSLVLSLQFFIGAWRNFSISRNLGSLFLIIFIIIFLSLIIYPNFNIKFINKYFLKFGQFIFNLINKAILATVYLVTLPFSYLVGRKNVIKNREELKPWVTGNSDWRISTWRLAGYLNKQDEKKGAISSLFYIFLREKNIFLLIILILILIFSTIILFAQSSAVAPFIYTIF